MPKFTKQDVLDELRKILLVQGDHLIITAGPNVAEAFIGFPPGPYDWFYEGSDPALIDLSRFNIARLFDWCFDYAFTPSVLTRHDESYVQDLLVFMQGIPKCDNGGDMLPFLSNGLCHTVAEASHARFALEEGLDLTTSQVALMANMTEGAVRNALAQKGDGGLHAIPGTKNPVMIEHAEALRWLHGRRGFVPTPENLSDDRFLIAQISNSRSARDLGKLLGRIQRAAFESPEKAQEALGWSEEKLQSWLDGTQEFSVEDAAHLAKAINIDVPLFVGKVQEVVLRRHLETENGEVMA